MSQSFLRDGAIDQRLLLTLVHEREGKNQEARRELEQLLAMEPDHGLANHLHEGLLDNAIQCCEKAIAAAPTFIPGH